MTQNGPYDPAEITRSLALRLGRLPIAAAWLYGSLARGDARRESDADVGVLLAVHIQTDRRRVLHQIERAAREALVDRELSVVDLEHAPLLLRHRVLRDGVMFLEHDPSARSRFASGVLERFCAASAVRRTFDNATRYRLAHAVPGMGAL